MKASSYRCINRTFCRCLASPDPYRREISAARILLVRPERFVAAAFAPDDIAYIERALRAYLDTAMA